MHAVNTELVQTSVPAIYDTVRRERCPAFRWDMSQSNQCHQLTLGMLGILEANREPARREMHELGTGSWWHFVIAHGDVTAAPSDDDIITDLNPWQYNVEGWESDQRIAAADEGYLHGPRGMVMERLAKAGAPEWFVGLRGLATITEAHTTELTPGLHWLPRRMNDLGALIDRLSRPA
jgi:hypothetical protein